MTDPIEQGLRRLDVDLSPLLRYVLSLVCLGHTDAEIAEKLDVAPRTAKGYLSRIFAATSTTGRVALVAEVLGGLKAIRREAKTAEAFWRSARVVVRRAPP